MESRQTISRLASSIALALLLLPTFSALFCAAHLQKMIEIPSSVKMKTITEAVFHIPCHCNIKQMTLLVVYLKNRYDHLQMGSVYSLEGTLRLTLVSISVIYMISHYLSG